MEVIEKGHIYALEALDAADDSIDVKLTFVNRELGTQHAGTTTQEVIRALIDRTEHCHECRPWPGNEAIIYHLRMALVLHEARALMRKVHDGKLQPELIGTGFDGHFALSHIRLGDGIRYKAISRSAEYIRAIEP